MDSPSTALVRASFNPLIRWYLLLYVAFLLSATVFLIPVAVVWMCGPGQWWARHYYERLLCEVDGETLRFRHGILFTVEKTIPLENIQDVTFVEGPLLRAFHLATLKFETAGQSEGQAHAMQLTGVIDAVALRELILERRRVVRARPDGGVAVTADQVALLREVVTHLDEIKRLLQSRSP